MIAAAEKALALDTSVETASADRLRTDLRFGDGAITQTDSLQHGVGRLAMILDPDLPLLEDVAAILDAHLIRIQLQARSGEDPDAEGIFDRLEHVTGLGFAACQNFIVSWAGRSRLPKQLALQLGPKHRTGYPMVALVNTAANYWKHRPEWSEPHATPGGRTADLLASLGVRLSEYALTNILYELVRPLPSTFATVVPFLVHWRDELAAA